MPTCRQELHCGSDAAQFADDEPALITRRLADVPTVG